MNGVERRHQEHDPQRAVDGDGLAPPFLGLQPQIHPKIVYKGGDHAVIEHHVHRMGGIQRIHHIRLSPIDGGDQVGHHDAHEDQQQPAQAFGFLGFEGRVKRKAENDKDQPQDARQIRCRIK